MTNSDAIMLDIMRGCCYYPVKVCGPHFAATGQGGEADWLLVHSELKYSDSTTARHSPHEPLHLAMRVLFQSVRAFAAFKPKTVRLS